MIEKLTSFMIESLQTDHGKEYVSHAFNQFLQDNSITNKLTCLYTHPQNGTAERKHKHITCQYQDGFVLSATLHSIVDNGSIFQ